MMKVLKEEEEEEERKKEIHDKVERVLRTLYHDMDWPYNIEQITITPFGVQYVVSHNQDWYWTESNRVIILKSLEKAFGIKYLDIYPKANFVVASMKRHWYKSLKKE